MWVPADISLPVVRGDYGSSRNRWVEEGARLGVVVPYVRCWSDGRLGGAMTHPANRHLPCDVQAFLARHTRKTLDKAAREAKLVVKRMRTCGPINKGAT